MCGSVYNNGKTILGKKLLRSFGSVLEVAIDLAPSYTREENRDFLNFFINEPKLRDLSHQNFVSFNTFLVYNFSAKVSCFILYLLLTFNTPEENLTEC